MLSMVSKAETELMMVDLGLLETSVQVSREHMFT